MPKAKLHRHALSIILASVSWLAAGAYEAQGGVVGQPQGVAAGLPSGVTPSVCTGDVVINEFSAASSDRLLRWSDEGVPTVGMGIPWTEVGFDDSRWSEGEGGFGYGDSGYGTVVNLRNTAQSLYVRKTFVVSAAQASSADPLELQVKYDDGFVAYLNGVEVARGGCGSPGGFHYHDQPANNDFHEALTWETFPLQAAQALLVTGTNVLALQVHNGALDSEDLTLFANLNLVGTWVQRLARWSDVWKYQPGTAEPSGGWPEEGNSLPPHLTLVNHGDDWQYFVGTAEPSGAADLEWTLSAFDDSAWESGPGGLGYGDGDDATVIDLPSYNAVSLYIRRAFTIAPGQLAESGLLRLSVIHDDGFVAYLNGVEVHRANLGTPGEIVPYDGLANGYIEPTLSTLTIGDPLSLLQEGLNVLAIQVHNHSLESSDLSIIADLEYTDESGEANTSRNFLDWIELYNRGASPVSLAGWSLSDDPGRPDKWVFPEKTLEAGQYLLVLASGEDRRPTDGSPLHANFKLDAQGEYLALFNAASPRQAVCEFAPEFPPPSAFQSFGRYGEGNEYCYFERPTPGAANALDATYAGFVPDVDFNPPPGFYDGTVSVELSNPAEDTVIRYTTDGTVPTLSAGLPYSGPILLTQSTALRARAFKAGCLPSRVGTRSYLLNLPPAFKTLPVLSLVSDEERNFFNPHGVLAYMPEYKNQLFHGRAFERPVSVELIRPGDNGGFRLDAGIRMVGGGSRTALTPGDNWHEPLHKYSLRLHFRGDYEGRLRYPLFEGAPVEEFELLQLRGGYWDDSTNPYIRDELVRRLFIDMGYVGAYGTFVNLFINGEYKSYYNLVERMHDDAYFFQQHYQSENDWDVIQRDAVESGDRVKWDELWAILNNEDLSQYASYQKVEQLLDVVNFVDYLLVRIYPACGDWPQNNYVIARERCPEGRFRFYVWDAGNSFGGCHRPIYYNTIGIALEDPLYEQQYGPQWANNPISLMHRALKHSPEYRMLFADRIQKHFFGDGVLTDAHILQRFRQYRAIMERMVCHVFGSYDTSIETVWIPGRRGYLLNDSGYFAQSNVWPSVRAPAFSRAGGLVEAGFPLEVSNPNAQGTIYYTVDGSDPRTPGSGAVSSLARPCTGTLTIDTSLDVKARVLDGATWSPLSEASFQVNTASPGDLIVTEFLANVDGPDEGQEWLELFNTTGAGIDIRGWRLVDNDNDEHTIAGAAPVVVPAKGYLVLGATTDSSANGGAPVDYAYGDGFTLGNEGDEIILLENDTLVDSIAYGAFNPLPRQVLADLGREAPRDVALGMALDYCDGPVATWVEQTSPYGTNGVLGTPGAHNDGASVCADDTTAPALLEAKAARGDLILLIFDELLEPLSAESVANYSLSPAHAGITAATLDRGSRVLLALSGPLEPDVEYTVGAVGVSDLFANPIGVPEEETLSFSVPEVSITEIMYNNRGTDVEWLELYNTTDALLDLSGWYLTDDNAYPASGEGSVIFPAGTYIRPREHVVVNLWGAAEFAQWQIPAGIRVLTPQVQVLGALSNGGDNLALFDAATGGRLIDGSLAASFPDLARDGESLEKIDERFPWGDADTAQYNFRPAAVAIGFETALTLEGELLSERASPGRTNGSAYVPPGSFWSLH